jgi:hypothetical protein
MKYLIILLAVVAIGVSLVAPKQVVLFPERPYEGAYSGAK